MWKSFSLRTRLFLPLGAMFVAALVVGGVSLRIFRRTNCRKKASRRRVRPNRSPRRSTARCALAQSAADARGVRQALGTIGGDPFPAGRTARPRPPRVRTPLGRVPRWFLDLWHSGRRRRLSGHDRGTSASATSCSRRTFRPKYSKSGSGFSRSPSPDLA